MANETKKTSSVKTTSSKLTPSKTTSKTTTSKTTAAKPQPKASTTKTVKPVEKTPVKTKTVVKPVVKTVPKPVEKKGVIPAPKTTTARTVVKKVKPVEVIEEEIVDEYNDLLDQELLDDELLDEEEDDDDYEDEDEDEDDEFLDEDEDVEIEELKIDDLDDFIVEEEEVNDQTIVVDNRREVTETPVVVIDNETSDALKLIKSQEVFNKPKEETSEESDLKTVEEETIVGADVTRYLDTDITKGLNDEQIQKRIEEKLTNDAGDDSGKSILEIILTNVFTLFNILYFIITVILIILQKYSSLVFLFAVIPSIIIGIWQEIKSKLSVDKMKIMSAPVATVMRNGKKLEIGVKEVVLDEILIFQTGRQICADCIVSDGNVEVNESLLTGESDSIPKSKGARLLSGSFITSGTCVARADRVGKDCYIAKMSNEAKKYSRPESELLKSLKSIIRVICWMFPIIIVLYMLSRIQGPINWESFKAVFDERNIETISYIVLALIPAGLFLLTSVALFVGVRRLAKNKTLVQELYCIEMLARVDVLCLDKTGTITDGTMRVCDCVEVNNPTDYTIREIIGSMMSSFEETNPTSEAMIKYFDKNTVLTPTEIIPFSSKRKFSAVSFGQEGTFILGAPDFVVKDYFEKIESKVTRFSLQGCRVIVLGYLANKLTSDELPKNVRPLALIVIQDHIREDAPETISFFKQNGVDVKVISGDNPETVSKIAMRVGIDNANRYINLNGLTDEEIRDKVFDYTVFGRVTPSQKKLIVQVLKENGKTVAMTGDGVNDIPALKEAHCSIAMASGSEAARYVSHLVLTDSNFSSMPKVVKEGRRVINNIQKTSALYLTKNLFAFLVAIMYIVIGFLTKSNPHFTNTEFPYKPMNLFLIEFVILAFATFCLAVQPNTEIVKGKFFGNVFKQTLPGALTILVYQMILFFIQTIKFDNSLLFAQLASETSAVYPTLAAILTTTIMIYVLFFACRPFNWYRKFVVSVTILIIFLCIALPWTRVELEFNFSNFGSSEWLLFIILFQAIGPVMYVIRNILVGLHILPKTIKEVK